MPALLELAQRGGYLAQDVEACFDDFKLKLGDWPAEGPPALDIPQLEMPVLEREARMHLMLLCEVEAMLFAMALEHVATAAVQIGADRGTGGTSGVEFLLLSTFRRAFPKLWASGLGAVLSKEIA